MLNGKNYFSRTIAVYHKGRDSDDRRTIATYSIDASMHHRPKDGRAQTTS